MGHAPDLLGDEVLDRLMGERDPGVGGGFASALTPAGGAL